MEVPIKLSEALADLEHEQWMMWSKTIANRLLNAKNSSDAIVEQVNKWSPNWKPYNELDEATKEFDRIWARKVLSLLFQEVEKLLKENIYLYEKDIEFLSKSGKDKDLLNVRKGQVSAYKSIIKFIEGKGDLR